MIELQPTLLALQSGRPLTEMEAEEAFAIILAGRATDAQIGALLAMVAARGVTVDELVGATRSIRRHATPVPRPASGPFAGARLLDTCGTGGAPKLFNISTIGAIIIAAAGGGRIAVCKHGNVSRTGRGSAELMQALGVRVDADSQTQLRCLESVGICFSLAPAHHPAVRHASAARKSLGFPTMFNLLGPLANPAGAEHQVMGTWTRDNAALLAAALHRLGCRRAIVFSSRDGLDELTTTDINFVHEVGPAGVRAFELDGAVLGLARPSLDDLRVDSLERAVALARAILAGRPGPCRDVALLNAAAGLWIGTGEKSIEEWFPVAADAVDSGRAARTLDGLVRLSNEARA